MSVLATFQDHARVVAAAERLATTLEQVVGELNDCFKRGDKLMACGNGGSASDAEHLVAELVGRFKDDRLALPALALSAGGTATLTAVANDYGYDTVFARQVEALARPGDLLFAISTSGNCIHAICESLDRRLGVGQP